MRKPRQIVLGILPARARTALRSARTLSRGGRIIEGPVTFYADGLATTHNADFQRDPAFAKAYEAGRATGSWHGWELPWRAHVVCEIARHCASIPGDFVECGVNRGGFAAMLVRYLNFDRLDKKMYLLDTFRGLDPAKLVGDEAQTVGQKYDYSECFEDVQRTFRPFANVVLVRGPVPDTLPRVTSPRIAYLSIDMNCVAPEIAAAEHFWPRLSPGAVMVLDDYGFAAHRLQKAAFDEFAKRHGVGVLSLPTGQGLIFKPYAAS